MPDRSQNVVEFFAGCRENLPVTIAYMSNAKKSPEILNQSINQSS